MTTSIEARDFPVSAKLRRSGDGSPDLLIHPAKPARLKRYRAGRTCNNCVLYHCRSDFKAGCWYHDNEPARNPRARALRCRMFQHWNDAFNNLDLP